jgi:hypothetical protein
MADFLFNQYDDVEIPLNSEMISMKKYERWMQVCQANYIALLTEKTNSENIYEDFDQTVLFDCYDCTFSRYEACSQPQN